MKLSTIRPEFVEFIPRELEQGVLYISERYQTASHLCACGCGEKVVTPLSPADWRLHRDQEGLVTLHPSIGNWNHPCRSHYWIRKNWVQWAGTMTAGQIERVKAKDIADKARYIDEVNRKKEAQSPERRNTVMGTRPAEGPQSWEGLLARLRRLVGL
jgi:Family of unknown function (DUF6527)